MKFKEAVEIIIPIEEHGEHPDSPGHTVITGHKMVFDAGTDKRHAQRDFRKFLKSYNVHNWRNVAKQMGFKELL